MSGNLIRLIPEKEKMHETRNLKIGYTWKFVTYFFHEIPWKRSASFRGAQGQDKPTRQFPRKAALDENRVLHWAKQQSIPQIKCYYKNLSREVMDCSSRNVSNYPGSNLFGKSIQYYTHLFILPCTRQTNEWIHGVFFIYHYCVCDWRIQLR